MTLFIEKPLDFIVISLWPIPERKMMSAVLEKEMVFSFKSSFQQLETDKPYFACMIQTFSPSSQNTLSRLALSAN